MHNCFAHLRTQGIECSLLTAEECLEKFPKLRIDDVEGGLWVPQDATLSPKRLLNTFANEAKRHGIKIIEHCEVQKVLVKTTHGGQYFKVRGVETSMGLIECDLFVNCAGIVNIFFSQLVCAAFLNNLNNN